MLSESAFACVWITKRFEFVGKTLGKASTVQEVVDLCVLSVWADFWEWEKFSIVLLHSTSKHQRLKGMTRHVHLLTLMYITSWTNSVLNPVSDILTVPMVTYLLYLRYPTFPPPQGDVRQLDDEVWALLSNFSNGRAASPPFFPFSSKSSSSSSSSYSSSSRVPTSSSSSRWSLRNLSPPSPPSGISSSVRPTRPQAYSPGHAPRLQVHSVKDWKRFTGLFDSG